MRQLRGREGLARREVDASAVPLDQRLLAKDVRRFVQHEVRVLGPLHIDVRMQRLDRRDGRRLVDDRHVVDDLQRGELPRAIFLAERYRSFFRDVRVCRDGDDEHVAERAGLLEVNQMAHVHEIECAVAQNDLLVAMPLADGG